MNNITKNKQNISFFVKTLTIIFLFLGLTGVCAGQVAPPSRLDVVFTPNPLFEKLNFLPGDSVTGTITVTNNSGTTQKIITEAINGTDPDGLGSVLDLRIFETSVTPDYYSNTLGYFLSFAGEVDLSTLNDGEIAVYTYEVTFGVGVEEYQNTTLGFDICVGFFDAAGRVCGDTVIGDEEDTDGEDSDDGGGVIPGSGGGLPSLTISNENATVGVDGGVSPPMNGTAIIEWNTNFLSTSQVIYGLASSDYDLDLNDPPYFGYPMGTDEDKIKVTSHSVFLEDLINGETYKYRVVSRASPPTISYEHTFFVEMEVGELLDEEGDPDLPVADEQDPNSLAYVSEPAADGQYPSVGQTGLFTTGQAGSEEGNTTGGGTSGTEEESGGISDTTGTDPDQTGSDPEKEVEPSGNLASALFAFLGNDLGVGKIILILLLLLLLFLIWRTMIKRSRNTGDV